MISFSLEFWAEKFKHLGITSPFLEQRIIITESPSWQDTIFLTRFCYSETLQSWSENICRCLYVIYSWIYLHFSYAMLNFLIFAEVEQKSQGLESTWTAGPCRHIRKCLWKHIFRKKCRYNLVKEVKHFSLY